MRHLTEAQLQRVLEQYGEGPAELILHLEGCADCQHALSREAALDVQLTLAGQLLRDDPAGCGDLGIGPNSAAGACAGHDAASARPLSTFCFSSPGAWEEISGVRALEGEDRGSSFRRAGIRRVGAASLLAASFCLLLLAMPLLTGTTGGYPRPVTALRPGAGCYQTTWCRDWPERTPDSESPR